jgi:hypothetical protein
MRFTPSRSLSTSQLSRRSIALFVAAMPFAASAQAYAPARVASQPDSDLLRARAKVAAYADLIDITFPIGAMWRRYTGFVNVERGPTGRESRINGLMAPRDAARELAAAELQLTRGPAFSECDAAVQALIRLYAEAEPLIAEAAAYHELNIHREDEGAKARAYHARLREVVPLLLAARLDTQAKLEPIRAIVEQAELAAFERANGRDGRWHIRRATVEARKVMAVFPRAGGIIDMDRLEAALVTYEAVVLETEAFGQTHPDALLAFGQSPRGFAAGIRRVQGRVIAFPASPKRWAPEIGDIDAPFQTLTRMADAMLRNIA